MTNQFADQIEELMDYLSEGEVENLDNISEQDLLRDSPEIGVIPNEIVEPKFSVQLKETVATADKATQTTSPEEPNPPPVATNCCVHNMEQSNRRSFAPRVRRNFIPPQRNVNSGRIERRTNFLRVYRPNGSSMPICFRCKCVGHVAKYCNA